VEGTFQSRAGPWARAGGPQSLADMALEEFLIPRGGGPGESCGASSQALQGSCTADQGAQQHPHQQHHQHQHQQPLPQQQQQGRVHPRNQLQQLQQQLPSSSSRETR